MKFTKMQGIGNDYVYVNCFEEKVEDPSALAVKISDRHFGVGSDGLILIKPSLIADVEMEMYNADGSRGKMCGNGIRCVGKYVYDHGVTDKTDLRVATGAGVRRILLTARHGRVSEVTVDMGAPSFAAGKVPVKSELPEVVDQTVDVAGRAWRVTCVSMGNPHCVVPVESVEDLALEKIGPAFEKHGMFPEGVNTEFIRVADEHTVWMRVWERGSGETLACGTGACAAAAACIRNKAVAEHVTVKLRGGDLDIFWDRQKNTIWMKGPAVTVFEGDWA